MNAEKEERGDLTTEYTEITEMNTEREMDKGQYKDRPYDKLTRKIIGAAIEVHNNLGHGLLESAYDTCMIHELQQNGLKVERQKELPITYKGIVLDCGYRLDLLIEERVILEIKAVEALTKVHEA